MQEFGHIIVSIDAQWGGRGPVSVGIKGGADARVYFWLQYISELGLYDVSPVEFEDALANQNEKTGLIGPGNLDSPRRVAKYDRLTR